ncbi:ATP-grasp domain-containing protein [Pseudomonas fragi]|uniref:ATP-grasp domain-containing protein n=1 Tax=Pseudomonas fragi TaxID=296 RepID=UPI00147405D5|nr:ATP-grasp domain-containing protein [Pseudomonas fragi]NNB56664.1 ATP-grasp domain-containing protein [Pseudomonas fragi]
MIRVVVVDGFSSGKFLAKKLHEDGCVLFHIASSPDIDGYYYVGFDSAIYERSIVHTQTTCTLLELTHFDPDIIIAGAESGVLLADVLNEQLGLDYANVFSRSLARRNKYQMIQCITEAGLPAPAQCAVDTWRDGKMWVAAHGKYPVVVKPLESAGADGVYICRDLAACKGAFKALMGTRNKLNLDNSQVLFQEYLAGTEYVVNMVSLHGHPLVTEVVKYTKRVLETGSIVYDIDQLLACTDAPYAELVAYTREVVTCLGIRNGPSHAEVMYTEDGPKLVEIAARTDGILRPGVSALTTGLGQIDACALSITRPLEFEQLLASNQDYALFKHTYNVCLINCTEGVFCDEAFVQQLRTLASFFEVVFYVKNGQRIAPTRDVFSQPGTVYLIHDDLAQIEADYARIREMEAAGIYLQESQ